MEIQFQSPTVRWLAPHANAEVAPTAVPRDSSVAVSFPVRDAETHEIKSHVVRLPCQFSLSFEDEQALLKHAVVFTVTSGGREIATYKLTLADCLPILEDSAIEWRSRVSSAKHDSELHVTVPVVTSRRPREAIANVLAYRDHALSLAQKLTLHKNTVAIGLLPPILGCFGGVLLTAPLWVPFTLFIGIIGFPLWVVVGVAASLVIAISAVSSVATVKALQSRRVKAAVRELAQSPSGQYVLFANAGNTRVPSPAQLAERAKLYVNQDPSRKLLASLVVDFIGNATFVVPGLGELADLFWAPASAALVGAMYADSTPSAKYFAFLEEVLPFTDFIPTATLAWVKENLHKEDFKNLVGKLVAGANKKAQ